MPVIWWGYYQPLLIFSFLNWLMLFGWWVTLLVSSIRAASNGISGVWRTPVREHLGRSSNATPPRGRPAATTYPTVPANNYGGPVPGQIHSGYGMPPQQQQPYWPHQGYGMPPPQQPYSTPQPQQGYGPPAPQQGYWTPQPQTIYSAPAPGPPPDTSQG
ncbi:hypothetical protein FRC00_001770 [Tulasnella sp. 408]|nr:hypothetical protein FRC00_001770 [Tulasnella sp. 408]